MQRITSLTLEMHPSQKMSVEDTASLGPFLQGVLMEHVSESYAEHLHNLPFNPYSQYCFKDNDSGNMVWKINTLSEAASEEIVFPLSKLDEVSLKKFDTPLLVEKRNIEIINLKQLTDSIYEDQDCKKIRLSFVTPTSFRSNKSYAIMPSVRLIFQNLLMHYGQVYAGSKEIDQGAIDGICANSVISSYSLRSRYFENAASKGLLIPGFVGGITLSQRSKSPITGLTRMLARFGEYAGVGIKTSMGMGGMRCQ